MALLTLWEFLLFLHLKKLEFPSSKNDLCWDWLKLTHWFWRRRFLDFVNVFSLFRNYLPLENGRALQLNKLEYPSPKDALCQVWSKLAKWLLRKRFFNFVNVFLLFRIYLPWNMVGPFIWTNLNPFTQASRMLCAKFDWNWSNGSWKEEDFLKL